MTAVAMFVWTIRDACGIAVLAFAALCFASYGVLVGLDVLEKWIRRKANHSPEVDG